MGTSREMAVFLGALDNLDQALDELSEMINTMKGRAEAIRRAHANGTRLREIVPAEESPLLVQLLTDATNRLHSYGNRVRRSEARALYEEGMTMEEIASLFGVTRQRVSALLRDDREKS